MAAEDGDGQMAAAPVSSTFAGILLFLTCAFCFPIHVRSLKFGDFPLMNMEFGM